MGACMMGAVMLVMFLLSMGLNVLEGNYGMLPPLAVASIPPVFAFFLLWREKKDAGKALFLLNGTLVLLGAYLLLARGASYGASLLWFVTFPPVFMLSLGLRWGSTMFGGFFVFLCIVLLTPLNAHMADQLPSAMRVRLLLVMLGIFIFSWWSELLRSYMYHALRRAGERLEEEAHTDSLTRLGNRRDCEKYFHDVKSKAVREGKPFSLLLIDLDHFKTINDTYGHPVGDAVLIYIAQGMLAHTRPLERVFRWGGEEFAVLLPGVDVQEARVVAERLRRYVEEAVYSDEGGRIQTTVSIGIYSGCGVEDLAQAFKAADSNLYKAKATGRNKVVV